MTLTADNPVMSVMISTAPRQPSARGRALNARKTGTMIRSAVASPSHHVRQSAPNAVHGWRPPAHKVATPIVALTIVLAIAPKTTTPSVHRSQLRDNGVPTYRRINDAAITA